jgi:protein-tyrosine phosphatase
MAQAMLTSLVGARGFEAAVASAGLLPGAAPLPVETRDVLIRRGFNESSVSRFRSQQLTDDLVRGADLVLGMAREHVREVIVRVPEAWERTFTLKELVRRGQAGGARHPDEELRSWLARIGQGRDRGELLGSSLVDDVADPIGGPPSRFEHTASEIEGLCRSLTSLLWP